MTTSLDPAELSAHDRRFTASAILEKADKVEKLGKAAADQGYQKEGAVLKGDAAYAREELVGAFQEQLEAFAKTEDEVRTGISNILFEAIQKDIAIKQKPAATCDMLAGKVLAFGLEIYTRAYAAGVADRKNYAAPAILTSSLVGLRTGRVGSDEEAG